MADSERLVNNGTRKLGARTLRPLALIAVAIVLALAAYRLWPKSPLDPKQPSTWPVSENRAIVLASGLQKPCPHNDFWWEITGREWREAGTWQQPSYPSGDLITLSKAGILCVRSVRDLGNLHKIGPGAEDEPNSALFLAVTRKDGACPSGTNYETDQYCLKQTKLPPAPDITP